jgi:hypothetical protein
MANKLEKIAEKKRQAALEKQEQDVAAFARRVADEVTGNITVDTTNDLKESVVELATSVANAVVASNKTFDAQLKDSFTQLLSAVKENKPDISSQTKLNREIGKSLAKFETALSQIEFAPEITLAGITADELKREVDKILSRLPESSRREVSLAYNNATADKYVNVRLTDGIEFYKALGGGGVSGLGSLIEKQDDIITAIGNIGGSTNYTTRIDTVGDLTYIGNAVIGSATSGALWQIKRLDASSGLVKLWADGNDNFDNVWDNRTLLSYS